ncbi:MAG: hypothetical protein HQL67_08035 [Magnetococcales bacterium]|nr:hypothetical protein [Magnetococcales bacterium]
MKLEEGIGLIAVIFILSLVVAAVMPDDLWEGESLESKMRSTLHSGPGVTPASNAWAAGPLQGVAVAAVTPTQQMTVAPNSNFVTDPALDRTTVPQPGLIPFSQAPRVNFSGTIQQITELQKQDGQIHIWLTDSTTGIDQRISVAPSWFLKYTGCTLLHDMAISGTGFQFDKTLGKNALIYAKKIVINRRPCHLRNDEGFALWSNKLR